MKEERNEYMIAWNEAHKEERKEYKKAYYQAHKKDLKAYYEAHKDERKAYQKAWSQSNKEQVKAWRAANKEQINEYKKAYHKADVNSLGQTKNSIRLKSRSILNKSGFKIPDYEIHHCFGYDDPSKFIYISKSLHLKIHQFLRDNNISADTDHWMAIRDLVNSTDEFMYIKC